MDIAENDSERKELLRRLNLTDDDARVLVYIADNGMLKFEEIRKATGLDEKRLRAVLSKLISRGYINSLATDRQYGL